MVEVNEGSRISNVQRMVLIALAAAVLVGSLLLFGSGDYDEPSGTAAPTAEPSTARGGAGATARPRATTIVARGGRPVGGVTAIRVEKGERVRLVVDADAPDAVHIHGYDITREAAPGRPARFEFKATIEGVFEVESHHSATQLAKLEVRPS